MVVTPQPRQSSWSPPQLVGGQFQSQTDYDDWWKLASSGGKAYDPGSRMGHFTQFSPEENAAREWGVQQGLIPAGGSFGGDFVKSIAPIAAIALGGPLIGSYMAGAGAAGAAGGGAAGGTAASVGPAMGAGAGTGTAVGTGAGTAATGAGAMWSPGVTAGTTSGAGLTSGGYGALSSAGSVGAGGGGMTGLVNSAMNFFKNPIVAGGQGGGGITGGQLALSGADMLMRYQQQRELRRIAEESARMSDPMNQPQRRQAQDLLNAYLSGGQDITQQPMVQAELDYLDRLATAKLAQQGMTGAGNAIPAYMDYAIEGMNRQALPYLDFLSQTGGFTQGPGVGGQLYGQYQSQATGAPFQALNSFGQIMGQNQGNDILINYLNSLRDSPSGTSYMKA